MADSKGKAEGKGKADGKGKTDGTSKADAVAKTDGQTKSDSTENAGDCCAACLTVTVLRVRCLKNPKAEGPVSATIKVEFGEQLLCESEPVEFACDCTEVNFPASMSVPVDSPLAIDEIACRPILVTFQEVSAAPAATKDLKKGTDKVPAQEKKGPDKAAQQEKKTQEKSSQGAILGQCTVDLLFLLHGLTEQCQTLTLLPVPGSPLEGLTAEQAQPEVDILVSVNQSVLNCDQLSEGNILFVTVESLYSPPEAFATAGAGFAYVAATPVPLSCELENVLVFAGGELLLPGSKDICDQHKKWSIVAGALGAATHISNQMIPVEWMDDEWGELKFKEDECFRRQAELEKPQVTWNSERRTFLDGEAVLSLKETICNNRYWPIEVFRTTTAGSSKGKGKGTEEEVVGFHGVAYVDLAPLLYPGVKRIRGAYRVRPFLEHDLYEISKRCGSIVEEAARIATAILTRAPSLMIVPKPAGGVRKEEPKVPEKGGPAVKEKKGAAGSKNEVEAEQPPSNPEGQLYLEANSYIMIEICLHQPLVRKIPDEESLKRVAEFIPCRPMFPKRTNCAERAVQEFHCQVGAVSSMLLEEFREQMCEGGFPCPSVCDDKFEEKRQQFLYHLNTSGKYLAFKEQLKHSVIKIVRERYLKTSNFQDKNELQAFLCELYVYLIDEMHCGLNKVLAVEDERPIPCPITTSAQLLHFAREAEVNENTELAAQYYLERIAREKDDPCHWLDYGGFCINKNDLAKAEECFKECVSMDQCHIQGIVLTGIACSMQCKMDQAEMMFQAATALDPCSIFVWTIFGLHYEGAGNEIQAERCLNEANRLNYAAALALAEAILPVCVESPPSDGVSPPPEGGINESGKGKGGKVADDVEEQPAEVMVEVPVVPAESIYMQVIDFLLQYKAIPFAERALAHHLLDPLGGPTNEYHIHHARVKLQQRCMEEVEASVNCAIHIKYMNVEAWSLYGHMKYMCGDYENAKECYERVLSFQCDTPELHYIYIRLASIHLQAGNYEAARNTFLCACKKTPSCVSWLGVGICSYRMSEFCDAEDALTEANLLNNLDAEVWAYLSLVCLQLGRKAEAEQAYKYATKLNLLDEDLKRELCELQQKVGFGNPEF